MSFRLKQIRPARHQSVSFDKKCCDLNKCLSLDDIHGDMFVARQGTYHIAGVCV